MNRKKLIAGSIAAGAAAVALALAQLSIPILSVAAKLFLAALAVLAVLWLAAKAYRAFLWRVGRRLAFSYFLVGILPIPLVLLATAVGAYILAGFFLGHLFRDASRQMAVELSRSAAIALHDFERRGATVAPPDDPEFAIGLYRHGVRVGGDERTPARWPAWLAAPTAPQTVRGPARREAVTPFVARSNGAPTIATVAGTAERGVVALYVGDLERQLSERSDVWVELFRPEDSDDQAQISIRFGSRQLDLQRLRRDQPTGEEAKFFKPRSTSEKFWDQPFLYWGETAGALLDLETGRVVTRYVAAKLRTTPQMLVRHYFSSSADFEAGVWGALLIVLFLLFDVYVVAAVMASVLIYGLSRAVNRLSKATQAVQQGDFGVRIPVRRRDQIGAMQRSFNDMAANLERLVASAAQKELLDKELAIARDLQKSLLPSTLPAGSRFATLFEPSAAIGGDYYDILPFGDREIAVMIADVAGHGLPTGLRMAMVKAALPILIEEVDEPAEILRRLDRVVRGASGARFFVTATLARIDLARAELELTNAGHSPTYLLRRGGVREIALPGSPLGGIGQRYGQAKVPLEPGDLIVWLSDGLIEAQNVTGEPFGYDATLAALAGPAETPEEVRDRLLAAIAAHVGDAPPTDDRTLVVYRFEGTDPVGVAPRPAV